MKILQICICIATGVARLTAVTAVLVSMKVNVEFKKKKKTFGAKWGLFLLFNNLNKHHSKREKGKKLDSTSKQILPHLHFYNAVIRYEDYGTWIHQTRTKMTSDRESFFPGCCYRWQMIVLPRDEQQQFIKSSPVVMAARLLPRSSGYSFWKTKEKIKPNVLWDLGLGTLHRNNYAL